MQAKENEHSMRAATYEWTVHINLHHIAFESGPADSFDLETSHGPLALTVGRRGDYEEVRINWTSTVETRPLARGAVSAAEFFFLDTRQQEPVSLGPTLLNSSLQHSRFIIKHADTHATPIPHDVLFSFPSRPSLELWTLSQLLSSASPYFRQLLSSEFTEGTKRTAHGHKSLLEGSDLSASDCDPSTNSDDEADEFNVPTIDCALSSPPETLEYHQIQKSTHAAHTTHRAIICWLQTGYFPFAALTSSISPPASMAAASSILSPKYQELEEWVRAHATLPLPSSPKSAYALAHRFELPALQQLCLANLKSQITSSNLAIELFSDFANKYDEPRQQLIGFALANWDEVKETEGFRPAMDKLKNGQVVAGAVVAALIPYIARG
ncbi:hypothetical protein JCM11641_005622 [Rhodosporidiobolus odoratus]